MRRYNCTYNAPNFLFPPLELLYLAAVAKEWKKGQAVIIDAIAEGLTLDEVVSRLRDFQPDILVFMFGIESYEEDRQAIRLIKDSFPGLKTACLGYLPSRFPARALEESPAVDYVIMDEPELSFSRLYDCLKGNGKLSGSLAGIAYRENGSPNIGPRRKRLRELDTLPYPARYLIRQGLYNEFLFKRPFTTMLTSRGCPFECDFCIPTYGREIVYRSPENVLGEIEETLARDKVRAIRFMDDTLTLNKERLKLICAGIIRRRLKFDWSCLSRVGGLDEELASLMRKAGARRVYLGIETFSQRLLDRYRKGYDASGINRQIKMIRDNDIEAAGFFIVGGLQTEEEFRRDVFQAKESGLDYVVVERLTPYPGTAIYKDKEAFLSEKEALEREKRFYRAFYFRPEYILRRLGRFLLNLKDSTLSLTEICRRFM